MDVNRLRPVQADEEVLFGFLHGKEATDIEERFGRALQVNKRNFSFQIKMPVEGSPDQKQVDFIVDQTWPIEVYGEIGHDSSAEQGADQIREALLNETFKEQGLLPMQVVWWYDLESQDQANELVRTRIF